MDQPGDVLGDARRKLVVTVNQIASCQMATSVISTIGEIELNVLQYFQGSSAATSEKFKGVIVIIVTKELAMLFFDNSDMVQFLRICMRWEA